MAFAVPFRAIADVGSGDRGEVERAGDAGESLRGGLEVSSSEASSPARASNSASRSSAIVNVLRSKSQPAI